MSARCYEMLRDATKAVPRIENENGEDTRYGKMSTQHTEAPGGGHPAAVESRAVTGRLEESRASDNINVESDEHEAYRRRGERA